MSDFVDARAGIAAARRIRSEMHNRAVQAALGLMAERDAQRASIVRRQIAEVLDIIDQRVERRLQRPDAIQAAPGHDGGGHVCRALCAAGRFLVRLGQVRHQETPHSLDLDIERIQAVLDLPNSLGITRHSASRTCCRGEEASHAEPDAHRLSGGAK
ncbi:hypothetical protein [Pelagerythrobacter marinus]|uniref:hypothetical protein n=1 Tax=Pelagerythrobacter marinus TaxID=538382 RepID=UPI002AC91101|nr:hypothetical protein [Pelagerythrobacter marinus]WPZ06610.1 hypothetical protein T8T98_14530 [Pelagerythrobacter marinus]